jgi:hypothetical protein
VGKNVALLQKFCEILSCSGLLNLAGCSNDIFNKIMRSSRSLEELSLPSSGNSCKQNNNSDKIGRGTISDILYFGFESICFANHSCGGANQIVSRQLTSRTMSFPKSWLELATTLGPVLFSTGLDSPVMIDSSTSNCPI